LKERWNCVTALIGYVTIASDLLLPSLFKNDGDGVDLHQELRARELDGDGDGGDRRQVWPRAPVPLEASLAGRRRPFGERLMIPRRRTVFLLFYFIAFYSLSEILLNPLRPFRTCYPIS